MERRANRNEGQVPGAEDTLDATPEASKRPDALGSTLAAESADGSSHDDLAADVPPPELIAERYRIQKRIGAGGFGVVYRAIDERLQKPVAIKVLGSRRAKHKAALDRFRAEALAAGRIHHPGIVTVTDFERLDDGRPYIVMELVAGDTLLEVLRRETTLSVSRACSLARMICQALEAAHHEGIIHRDLKPANVIVREDLRASDPIQLKLLDFGIAKLAEARRGEQITQSGQVLGTPAYIAPEQVRESSTIDGRADLYAVGVILYELVTGQLPFKTRDAANLLVSKVVDTPDPPTNYVPDLPPAFVKLVMRTISRDPNARPKTAAELATALEPFVDPIAVVPPRRPRWLVPGIVAGASAAALALALWLWSRPDEQPPPPPAAHDIAPAPAPQPPPPAPAVVEPPPAVVEPPPAVVEPPPAPAPAVAPKPVVKKKPPPRDRPVLPDSPLAPRAR